MLLADAGSLSFPPTGVTFSGNRQGGGEEEGVKEIAPSVYLRPAGKPTPPSPPRAEAVQYPPAPRERGGAAGPGSAPGRSPPQREGWEQKGPGAT